MQTMLLPDPTYDTRLTLSQLKVQQNRISSVQSRIIPWYRSKVHVLDSPSHILRLSFAVSPQTISFNRCSLSDVLLTD